MIKRLLLGVFALFLVIGCASKDLEVTTETDEDKPTIEKKAYKLVSFGHLRMAVPKKAKILLQDGQYAGNAGCNGMSGKYDLDENKIKFHSGISTLMACPDMRSETTFRQLLESVDSYELNGNKMTLKSGDKVVLIFMEQ
jgi:heat shock protein HslJ